MRVLLAILIELVTGVPPRAHDDRSIVGKSRMEELDERVWIGVVVLLVVAFVAYKMARANGWL